jgi:bifunctional enzyme CysN/CysC/sulfate adenylyltransferase subunit 1
MLLTREREIQHEGDGSLFVEQELNKELLRFTTAGSVDDGKSTLIGRLLHDCKAVYEDQLAAVKKSRINRSGRAIDFSLLTDGLRAEREQGITIDVAYRYFSTARRKFIIADTPGHEQYTRNMATGASTADLAVILVDATKGLLAQTRRHAYIASLLGISRVLTVINKMDLVDYREEVYLRLSEDFAALATHLGLSSVQTIPISALDGDNVVTRSEKTPWYAGPTMLEHLETVEIQPRDAFGALRFPVQSVIRPDATFRGFAGRVASGTVRPGDAILALPSRQRTKVESVVTFDGELEQASSGQSVVLKLADEIDLSRGDMLVSSDSVPHVSSRFTAMVVWLHPTPLELNQVYLAKHAGRLVKAKPTKIRFGVDINTLAQHSIRELEMNAIASVDFETSQALFFDTYSANRTTGSLILIDPLTNATIGAVMIREKLVPHGDDERRNRQRLAGKLRGRITPQERATRYGHLPAIFSLAGQREAAEGLERALLEQGFESVLVSNHEVTAPAKRALYGTLWNLGLVVVSWQETPIGARERNLMNQIAGKYHFELSRVDPVHAAESDVGRGLRIAEGLRLESDPAKDREN